MQVFIAEGNLIDDISDIPVVAYYPDGLTITSNMHGANAFVMYAPDSCLVRASSGMPGMVMKQSWRSDANQSAAVIDYEKNRRINIAFPTDEQTKANGTINSYIVNYGADSATWPAEAQSMKATIQSGWDYITAVTANADAMKQGTPPLDPTDDANWPAPITPIHIT